MNSHLFTFTNYKTERNSNFYNLYSKQKLSAKKVDFQILTDEKILNYFKLKKKNYL